MTNLKLLESKKALGLDEKMLDALAPHVISALHELALMDGIRLKMYYPPDSFPVDLLFTAPMSYMKAFKFVAEVWDYVLLSGEEGGVAYLAFIERLK